MYKSEVLKIMICYHIIKKISKHKKQREINTLCKVLNFDSEIEYR